LKLKCWIAKAETKNKEMIVEKKCLKSVFLSKMKPKERKAGSVIFG
jgi:hypothetical protein